jgi:L,D-transpeptidase catalytic domain
MSRKLALVVVLAGVVGAATTWALTRGIGSDGSAPSTTIVTRGERDGTTTTSTTTTTAKNAWPGSGYRLARVRRGEKVAVHSAPGGPVRRRLGHLGEFTSPRVFWVPEVRGKWLGVVAPEVGNNKLGWIRRDPKALRFKTTRYSLHVDLSKRLVQIRLGDQVIRNVVVTVGRFGSGTPAGRFAVTDRISKRLDPVYGCCAIALSAHQPNPPPGWIGGDRIAIHGWNGPVGEAASGGCLRASNRDMLALMRHAPLGTPVLIGS